MEINYKCLFTILISIVLCAGCSLKTKQDTKENKTKSIKIEESNISFVSKGKIYAKEIYQFNVYKEVLDEVDANNLNNIEKIQTIILDYLSTSNNQSLRDKAFGIYRIKFYRILRHTPVVYKGTIIDNCEYAPSNYEDLKIIENYFRQKGLRLMSMEGCYYVEEDNNFTIQKYSNFLSQPWKEYLLLRNKEDNRFINDGAVAMPWDELRHRIIYWENFVNKYPNFPENNEIKAKLADYLEWYITGKYAYDRGEGDVLGFELKESYEKFLNQDKKSKFYPTVETWYNLLKKNNFVYRYYFDGEKEVINDVAYKEFKIKQPYKVSSYNKDIYDGMSP